MWLSSGKTRGRAPASPLHFLFVSNYAENGSCLLLGEIVRKGSVENI